VLYWISGNAFAASQQLVVNRILRSAPAGCHAEPVGYDHRNDVADLHESSPSDQRGIFTRGSRTW
jgi:membrane protein insertase Oxa1/YidC/SpoIIIJ